MRVPEGGDWDADDRLKRLYGNITHEEDDYKYPDAASDLFVYGENSSFEEEKGDLREIGGGTIDDGACVEPLRSSSEPPYQHFCDIANLPSSLLDRTLSLSPKRDILRRSVPLAPPVRNSILVGGDSILTDKHRRGVKYDESLLWSV